MDKLNTDFNILLPYVINASTKVYGNILIPYVIEAFTKVYGEEYRSIISRKINKAVILSYHDVEGIYAYVSYLKRCKARQLSLKFLEEIEEYVPYKQNNYAQPLANDIEEILECYIGNSYFGFSHIKDSLAPLRAFDSDNNIDSEMLLDNKLIIINHLLGSEHEQITKENFSTFTKTKEYSEVLKRINQLNIIYEKVLKEYDDWKIQLQPYQKYVEYESARKKSYFPKKKKRSF